MPFEPIDYRQPDRVTWISVNQYRVIIGALILLIVFALGRIVYEWQWGAAQRQRTFTNALAATTRPAASDIGPTPWGRAGAARGVRSDEERPLTVEDVDDVFAGQGLLLHSLCGVGRRYFDANSDVVVLTRHPPDLQGHPNLGVRGRIGAARGWQGMRDLPVRRRPGSPN